MFTEDKIKQVIQENNIKECSANYTIQFDSFGDVVIYGENTSAIDKLKMKIEELEDTIRELEDEKWDLESRIEELEEELDDYS